MNFNKLIAVLLFVSMGPSLSFGQNLNLDQPIEFTPVERPTVDNKNWSSRYEFLVFEREALNSTKIPPKLQNEYFELLLEAYRKGFFPSVVLELPIESKLTYTDIKGNQFQTNNSRIESITMQVGEFVQKPMEKFMLDLDEALARNKDVYSVKMSLNRIANFPFTMPSAERNLLIKMEESFPLINRGESRALCDWVFKK